MVSQSGINSYLSVSEVVQDGGQFLGVGVLTLGHHGRVGIPPVHREPMEPHVGLLQVRLLQAGIEAVDLAARAGEGALQGPVILPQPAGGTGE